MHYRAMRPLHLHPYQKLLLERRQYSALYYSHLQGEYDVVIAEQTHVVKGEQIWVNQG